MAKMYPSLSQNRLAALRQQRLDGEVRFYEACRDQLDDGWIVRHSLHYITDGTHGPVHEGEADFVLMHYSHGLLAVEVKGGRIERDAVEGIWSSTDRENQVHLIKDPFVQASSALHAILEELKNSPRWSALNVFIKAGSAVFFPSLDDLSRIGPSSPRPEIVGGRAHLQDIKSWLISVMVFWAQGKPHMQPPGTRGAEIFESIFCSSAIHRPALASILAEEEDHRITLTYGQARIFEFISNYPRAIISGGAGTGKTLLALLRAKDLARAGKRTLLVCFNAALAAHLQTIILREQLANLTAMDFHALCKWRAKVVKTEHGIDLALEAAQQFPKQSEPVVHLPYMLMRSTEYSDLRYDAILVDEAQDFRGEYWDALEFLLKDGNEAQWYLFLDHNQTLYPTAKDLPVKEKPFLLSKNCRNTDPIHDLAYRFYNGTQTQRSGIVGGPVSLIVGPSLTAQARKLHACVTDLLNKERVVPEEIGILIAGSRDKAAYYDALRPLTLPGGCRYAIQDYRTDGGILVDTISRFKGLEAGILFIWGLDDLVADERPELIYVGLSRAKSRLYLVGLQEHCEAIIGGGAPPAEATS